MESATNEGYLNQLVIKYILQNTGLEILASAPEQERPAIFLDSIGWGQKKDYIEDTLNSYLADSLPKGNIYVFTPDDSFKYANVNASITNVGIRSTKDVATFNDALREIVELADANMGFGKQTIAQILFFDNISRRRFERELKGRLPEKVRGKEPYSIKLQSLNVPNYGTITLHQYTIK
jgi:hypothetical protein